MLPAVLHILREEGRAALFAGLGTACVSLAVSNCLYYYLYALLRDAALRVTRRSALGGAAALPVASAAGALNVLLTNPLWVLVVRLQAAERAPARKAAPPALQPLTVKAAPAGAADDASCVAAAAGDPAVPPPLPPKPPKAAPPPSPTALARAIYAEGGLRAFWKGTLPSLLMVSNPVRHTQRAHARALSSALARGRCTRCTCDAFLTLLRRAYAHMRICDVCVPRVRPRRLCSLRRTSG
jgi:adenine nucleotide transporter 17